MTSMLMRGGTATTAAFLIRQEQASDIPAREALLDASFGTNRNSRTCQRLRDGCGMPADGLALSAIYDGQFVGTVRLWNVDAGGREALVLGPLAVDPSCRALGVGAELMWHALSAAKTLGHGAVVLLGDAPYYARFGFTPELMLDLSLTGPFERDRLLGLELHAGALAGAAGSIIPLAHEHPTACQPDRATEQVLLRAA